MTTTDTATICARLRERHRMRQDLLRAEVRLTLQIKAICRRLVGGDIGEADKLYRAIEGKGDHEHAMAAIAVTAPLRSARDTLEASRTDIEKAMVKDARQLPIMPWVQAIRGFGELSLAGLIGETGDLASYATHSRLWKRLGLAVIGGERQRRIAGDAALEHGYSPTRRSLVWNIGQCVMKAQSARVDKTTGEVTREAGRYRQLYDDRKVYEADRVETRGHAHNRATRYMEKRLIRDLWNAWRALERTGADPLPVAA